MPDMTHSQKNKRNSTLSLGPHHMIRKLWMESANKETFSYFLEYDSVEPKIMALIRMLNIITIDGG
jgi:hypothetical protein